MTAVVPEKSRIAILGSSDTQAHLTRIITEAERHLVLVSPYVRFDKLRNLARHVQSALAKGVSVTLVLREKDFSTGKEEPLESEELNRLRSAGLKVFVLKDLHAKIYFSEKNALLTSLNLLDSSINNSIEIGTWIAAGTSEYQAVVAFLKNEIHPTAQALSATAAKAPEPAAPKREVRPVPVREPPAPQQFDEDEDDDEEDGDEDSGHCIRCGDDLDFDMDKPLCRGCYNSWKKYGDATYPEKYCHSCGDPKKTSVAKPLCRPCFDDIGVLSDDDIVF